MKTNKEMCYVGIFSLTSLFKLIDSLISNVVKYYLQIMNNKVSLKITLILTFLAILTVPPTVFQVSNAQLSSDDQNTILSMHNAERQQVGVPAMSWSDNVANDAQSWANHIASLGLTKEQFPPHATWEERNPQGENLAWGDKGAFPISVFVQGWADEKSNYVPGTPISPNDFLPGVPMIGHYTQMVWSSTTEIGCGLASDVIQDYLVCRYNPSGNSYGQTPY